MRGSGTRLIFLLATPRTKGVNGSVSEDLARTGMNATEELLDGLPIQVFFVKQKTAYEMRTWLEFRRVLFRSLDALVVRVVGAGRTDAEPLRARPHAVGLELGLGERDGGEPRGGRDRHRDRRLDHLARGGRDRKSVV